MIKQNTKDILAGVNATPFGRALQEFLDDQYAEIGNIQNATSWEDTVGRQHALKMIETLFGHMKMKKTETTQRNNYE